MVRNKEEKKTQNKYWHAGQIRYDIRETDNINEVLNQFDGKAIGANFASLVKKGMEPGMLLQKAEVGSINEVAGFLLNRGVNPELVLKKLKPRQIVKLAPQLMEKGLTSREILAAMKSQDVKSVGRLIKELVAAGMTADEIADSLSLTETLDCVDDLLEVGAHLDVHDLLSHIYDEDSRNTVRWKDVKNLMKYGVTIEEIVESLNLVDRRSHMVALLKRGANPLQLVSAGLWRNETANVHNYIEKVAYTWLKGAIDHLVEADVDIDKVAAYFSEERATVLKTRVEKMKQAKKKRQEEKMQAEMSTDDKEEEDKVREVLRGRE